MKKVGILLKIIILIIRHATGKNINKSSSKFVIFTEYKDNERYSINNRSDFINGNISGRCEDM